MARGSPRLTTILLLFAVLLPGCLQPPEDTVEPASEPEDDATPPAPPSEPVVADPAAVPPAKSEGVNASSWYVVDAGSAPDAALTAFWWTVPEGSVYEDPFFGTFETAILEVALVGGDGEAPTLTEWQLFTFARETDGLRQIASIGATPAETSGSLLVVQPLGSETPISSEPFAFRLGIDSVSDGDALGFVLAARSDEPQGFRLAFRVVSEEESEGFEPAEDVASFVAARGNATGARIEPSGRGTGLDVGAYMELNLGAPIPLHYVYRTAATEIEGALVAGEAQPFVSLRDQTFRFGFDQAGWTSANGVYYASDGVGTWEAATDMHGEALATSGYVAETSVIGTTAIVFGIPFYMHIAEGAGPAESAFSIQVDAVNANGFELVAVEQVSLGATLQDLLGLEAEVFSATFEGLAPVLSGVAATPQGDLVTLGASGMRTWIGAAR